MVQVNLRLDDQLKKESDEFFKELGMDLSTGIKIYLSKVVRDQAIPFELALPTDDFSRGVRDIENGNFVTVNSVEEMMRVIDDED